MVKVEGQKEQSEVLVLWKIYTPKEGLLEATTSLQRRPSEMKKVNATETGSVTTLGMTAKVLSISICARYDQ